MAEINVSLSTIQETRSRIEKMKWAVSELYSALIQAIREGELDLNCGAYDDFTAMIQQMRSNLSSTSSALAELERQLYSLENYVSAYLNGRWTS